MVAVLLHHGGDRGRDVFDHVRHVERLRVQIHLTGLDLGDVEHAIDQGQQMFAGGFDLREVADEAGQREVFGLLAHQFAVADDGVERRAQFVAHVGQELALRAARFLGRFLGAAELFFGPLARGDVFHRSLVIENFIIRVANDPHVFGNPDDRPILAVDRRLEAPDRIVLVHQPHKLRAPVRVDIKLPGDFLDVAFQLIRRSIPVNLGERGVGEQIFAVGRGLEDAFDGVFDDAAIGGLRGTLVMRWDGGGLLHGYFKRGRPRLGGRKLVSPAKAGTLPAVASRELGGRCYRYVTPLGVYYFHPVETMGTKKDSSKRNPPHFPGIRGETPNHDLLIYERFSHP